MKQLGRMMWPALVAVVLLAAPGASQETKKVSPVRDRATPLPADSASASAEAGVLRRPIGTEINGVVVLVGGTPVRGATVMLGTVTAESDSAGRFVFRAPDAAPIGPWDRVDVFIDSVAANVIEPGLVALRAWIAAGDTVRLVIRPGPDPARLEDDDVMRELMRRLVRGQGLDGMLPEVPVIRLPIIARDLGLPGDGLEGAINRWVGGAVAPYDLGLSALYEGRFGDALGHFRSIAVPDVEDLLGLARAEFGNGLNTAGLESVLSALGMTPPDSALGVVSDYGMGLLLNGRLADADSVLSRALWLAKRLPGVDAGGLVDAHSDLAGIRAVQARYGDSQALLDQAISLARPDSAKPPEVARTDVAALVKFVRGQEAARVRVDLGDILAAQGRLTEADSVFRAADAVLDPISADVPLTSARAKFGLGGVFGATGFLVGADSMNAEGIRVLEDGLDHGVLRPVQRAQMQNDLAGAYFAAGDDARAESTFEAARVTLAVAGDSLHPAADETLARLSALYAATDRLPEAEEAYRERLDQKERALCAPAEQDLEEGASASDRESECLESHPALAQARNDLAVVLDLDGDRDAADSLYRASLLGLQKSVGYQHPATLVVNENLVRNRRRLPWGRSGIEFSGFIGSLNDWPEEYNPDASDDQLRRDALVGLRLGYTFHPGVFVQAEIFNSLLRVADRNLDRRNLQVLMYGAAVGYNFQLSRGIQAFPVVGLGAAYLKPDEASSETDFQINGGIGFRGFLTPHIAVRLDARVHKIYDPLRGFRDRQAQAADTFAVAHDAYLTELAVGISYFHGEPFDSDDDGIANKHDACPKTPPGVPVDAIGCAADSDRDGIPDHRDMCPGTRLGASVNPAGCAGDADGDGIPDGLDQCEKTALGAIVDFEGCEIDSDGDGLADGLDACPAEAGDGGEAGGCPVRMPAAPSAPAMEMWALFEFPATDPLGLSPAAIAVLDAVIDSVAAHPDMLVEIRGHATPDTGTPEQNWSYSATRADVASRYIENGLGERYPDVAADRIENLVPIAAGTALPVDVIPSAEAAASNRRVQIIARRRSPTDR